MPADLRRPVVARCHAKMTEKLKTAFVDGETSFFGGEVLNLKGNIHFKAERMVVESPALASATCDELRMRNEMFKGVHEKLTMDSMDIFKTFCKPYDRIKISPTLGLENYCIAKEETKAVQKQGEEREHRCAGE